MSLSESIPPSKGPAKTWRQPSAQDLWAQAEITFAKYLEGPPQAYQYQASRPSDNILRQRQENYKQELAVEAALQPVAAASTHYPNSRAYYDTKNAIEKPDDHDNAKQPHEQCLTCISQGARCHGKSVKDGKCRGCRGFNKDGELTKGKRECRWRDASKGIFTYMDHKEYYSGKRLSNAKAEPEKEAKKDNDDKEDETSPVNNINAFVTIFDLTDTYARRIVQAIAATIIDGGWASRSSEANLNAMLTLAKEAWRQRPELDAALLDIIGRLKNMLALLKFVAYRQVTDLLPSSHPLCTFGKKVKESSRAASEDEEVEVTDE